MHWRRKDSVVCNRDRVRLEEGIMHKMSVTSKAGMKKREREREKGTEAV